jgi:tetraacyldisaccharide 4'-kinase
MREPDFWSRDDLAARTTATLLAPLGWVYGQSVRWKYERRTPYRSSARVVCVGNLTVGGSGKTPVAIAIARRLIAKSRRVMFLTRGYGRRTRDARLVNLQMDDMQTVGDEPLLLAQVAPTIVARDRVDGARLAELQGAEVIVMDDGHQNFGLVKNVSVVVVDAEVGFGNRRVLPAGPLREPVRQGLARADAVVVVDAGKPSLDGYTGEILRAWLEPWPNVSFTGRRVIPFAGIGRPNKFFVALRTLGAQIVEEHAFADHHAYSASEIENLKRRAVQMQAQLVTTEKDFVRLRPVDQKDVETLPVRAMFSDAAQLDRLLARLGEPLPA